GEKLTRANEIAIALIGLGITSLALSERPTIRTHLRALGFAAATGAFIAGYTIVDGLGARTAGSAHDYMVWLSLITSSVIVACAHLLQQGQRQPVSRRTRQAGIMAGHELRIVVGHLGTDDGSARACVSTARDCGRLCRHDRRPILKEKL